MMNSYPPAPSGSAPCCSDYPNCDCEPGEESEASLSDVVNGIIRDAKDPKKERQALLARVSGWVRAAKASPKVKRAFKRMVQNMDFSSGKQWDGSDDEKYVANITQRNIAQKVASLYAKNPVVKCKRRPGLDFAIWDETKSSLEAAMGMMQMAQQSAQMGMQMPVDPATQALLQDVMQGQQRRMQLDKQARTLELLIKAETDSQVPPYKLQMKQLVRRTCVCGVGYVKLGYQRVMQKRPEDVAKITDITQQLAMIERLGGDKADDKFQDTDADAEQMRLMLEGLQSGPDNHIVHEGLTYDFPPATSIIVDPKCRNIRTFLGARWVAQEFVMTVNDVKEIYKVDVGKEFTEYKPDGLRAQETSRRQDGATEDTNGSMCVIWEVYCKDDGLLYVICDGYKDFLEEPAPPPVKLRRFWPFFSLVFNETEDEERIYPQSDVEMIIPMQREYNRSRQALREQRIANRPAYAIAAGLLDEDDMKKLQDRPDNAILTLNGLQPGQDVRSVLQAIGSAPIDGALYDTTPVFEDILKVAGSQEANLGGNTGGTATESNIAEGSRAIAIASNVDDLDDFLKEVSEAAAHILLMNMNTETVTQLVGPGAVWPDVVTPQVANDILIELEAGSSGRPNKGAEVANFQQMAPILMQIPGISPEWLAKVAIRRMDDSLDLSEAIVAGMQSIVAMNAQKQMAIGADATADPNAQGGQGAANGGKNPDPAQAAPAPPPPSAPVA